MFQNKNARSFFPGMPTLRVENPFRRRTSIITMDCWLQAAKGYFKISSDITIALSPFMLNLETNAAIKLFLVSYDEYHDKTCHLQQPKL
jgi:hypothetical protein